MVVRQVHRVNRGAQQLVNIARNPGFQHFQGQCQGADFFIQVGIAQEQRAQIRTSQIQLQTAGGGMQGFGGAIQVSQIAGRGEQRTHRVRMGEPGGAGLLEPGLIVTATADGAKYPSGSLGRLRRLEFGKGLQGRLATCAQLGIEPGQSGGTGLSLVKQLILLHGVHDLRSPAEYFCTHLGRAIAYHLKHGIKTEFGDPFVKHAQGFAFSDVAFRLLVLRRVITQRRLIVDGRIVTYRYDFWRWLLIWRGLAGLGELRLIHHSAG